MTARTQVFPLAAGDPGIAFTIAKMRELIDQGKKSARVRAKALEILNAYRVRAFDWAGQARAVYDWILRNITFTPDPRGKEGLQTADWTLQYSRGDCDDFTTLICSLLGTIGMKCRMITVAGHPEDPTQFSHIYPEVSINGQWVPVDAARRNAAFGKSPSRYFRRRWWSVDSEAWGDMQGTEAYAPGQAPGAYRANLSPIWRRLRNIPSSPRITLGQLAARRRALRRSRSNYRFLGQDSVWGECAAGDTGCEIANAITAGTTGAANIITASRAAPTNLFPTTGYGSTARSPYGFSSAYGYPSAQPFFGGVSSTWLLIGLGLLGAVAVARR